MRAWAQRFQAWGKLAGIGRLTSHYMRHTAACSLLSGTWGYSPRSLEFVQHQLGHTEIQTTEKYYGKVIVGTWANEVALMTGTDSTVAPPRRRITAADLLGAPGASNGVQSAKTPSKSKVVTFDGHALRWFASQPSASRSEEMGE